MRIGPSGETLARLDSHARHAAGALALDGLWKDGYPVGFSWEDVDFLWNCLKAIDKRGENDAVDVMQLLGMNYDAYILHLAERIASLLPPRTSPPRADYVLNDAQTTYGHPAHHHAWPGELAGRRSAEHFRGCMLGGAVGDALGAPVEFMRLEEIRSAYGPEGILDLHAAYGIRGAITDDTQMALFTAEGLLRAEVRMNYKGICHMPSVVHHAYIRWLHTQGGRSRHEWSRQEMDGWLFAIPALHARRAPGNTCLEALQSGRMGTVEEPINDSKGCGTVMRIAPVGLMPGADAFRWGCELAAITHSHPSGILAAGCLAEIIYQIIQGHPLRTAVARGILRLRKMEHSEECLSAVLRAIDASEEGAPSPEIVERLGQGWIAEEALAIAVYCSMVHEDDFAAGVRLAVNHGGDSDSTGAITGNILGALLGESAIPPGWLDSVEMRREIEVLADDVLAWHRDDEDWRERYPGW